VHGLTEFAGQRLEVGPGDVADGEVAQGGETDHHERAPGHIGLRPGLLVDELVPLQHPQQPVGRGRHHAERLADLRNGPPGLLPEHVQQPQRLVHGLDPVRGLSHRFLPEEKQSEGIA
jgi:hypothetical protein